MAACMVSTTRYSTLPDHKLVLLDNHGEREIVPLAEGSEAAYSADGQTLFFTRWRKQPSFTKRYQGGCAESIWALRRQRAKPVPSPADWPGTSHNPMLWNARVYFLSDRDGVMNVYSMDDARPRRQAGEPSAHLRYCQPRPCPRAASFTHAARTCGRSI